MYPTLFQLGSFRVDSYSVIWFIALAIAIVWSINRLKLYELDEDESRRIMSLSFLFMIAGAMIFKHIRKIPAYIANPSLIPSLNSWGLSEMGAVLGAIISAFVLCMFSRKVSFFKLCDVAMPPAMLSIAIGRWGCFLNGCCVGQPSSVFWAVHFPHDRAGLFRHPVQIYYSVIALVIVGILLWVERRVMPLQKKKYHSVVAPLGMILYSLMRFAIVPVRDHHSLLYMAMHTLTYQCLSITFPLVCLWLLWSLRRLKADS